MEHTSDEIIADIEKAWRLGAGSLDERYKLGGHVTAVLFYLNRKYPEAKLRSQDLANKKISKIIERINSAGVP